MPTENEIMKYFEYKHLPHLPEKIQAVSQLICVVARDVDDVIPNSAEKSACLRKLLEAKDCAVRAAL